MNDTPPPPRRSRLHAWKPWLIPVLIALATVLMTGEPDDSLRWRLGIGLTLVLGAIYIIEELVWISKNRSRPCPNCGHQARIKAFRLRGKCPGCGYVP